MAPFQHGSATALPLAMIAQAVPMLTRHELASITERLIERLDMLDGNPDAEDDDPQGQCDEDGINTSSGAYKPHGTSFDGPGCWIADEGEMDWQRAETFGGGR